MILAPEHRTMIDSALARVPESIRPDAEKHILDRVRGILQLEATDLRRAINSALAKYAERV